MCKRLFLLMCVLALTASALAQAPVDLGGRFARATITRNDKPLLIGTIFKDTADNLVVLGAPLADVIARAYGVQPYQVVDAPAWVYEDHLYDIEAVPPPAQLVTADDTRMLRSLLADRFGLETYRGTRDVTMLVLDADRARQRALAIEAFGGEVAMYAARRAPVLQLGGPRARYALRGLPVLNMGTTGVNVATRAVVATVARGMREPVLDRTDLVAVHLTNVLGALTLPQHSFEQVVAELAHSGLRLERRAVPLDVLVVTDIEQPVLDIIDD